ncbi:5803_t:CDS:10 [Cetraspora pellucida]|uniref:5803_t:CDS:1 n=2 Tax=Gigasporaceae TaxID=36753 RepID=A0A9N8WMD8_9GLOM|nr:5803_t:CDS:10 [Cetraspora pellucida]
MESEVVYAIHPFKAESEDEVSFEFGEPIIVLEKDELYGDGWWKGKNIHGRVGLFPMNHTSYSKPVPIQLDPTNNSYNSYNSFYSQMVSTPNDMNLNNSDLNVPSPPFRMPTPSIEETIDDIQNKLKKMSVRSNEKQLNQNNSEPQQYPWSPKQGRRSRLFLSSSSSSRTVSTISSSSHRQSTESTKKNVTHADLVSPITSNEFVSTPKQGIQIKDHPSTWDVRQLHLSTLKELNVLSFGKRVHIMNAINALKAKHSIGVGPDDDVSDIDEYSGSVQPYSPTPVYRFQPKYNTSSPVLGRYAANHDFRKFPGLPESPRNSASNNPASYTQFKRIEDVDVANVEAVNPKSKKIKLLSKWNSLKKSKEKRNKLRTSSEGGYDINLNEEDNVIRNQFINDNIRPNSPSLEKNRGLRFSRKKHPGDSIIGSPLMIPKQSLEPESPHQYNKWEAIEDLSAIDLEVLKSIGEPDYEGWLKKQGDKYKTWKSRYFILKGADLYYLKNNKNIQHPKVKGHIDLTGYRIFTDENILPGKYGFKIVHDMLRTHFFAHEDIDVMKGWIKAMMKATISRDHNAPVISSSNINTVPLADARKMSPRPPQPRRPSLSPTAILSPPILRPPPPTFVKEKQNPYITTMGSSSTTFIQNTPMYPNMSSYN